MEWEITQFSEQETERKESEGNWQKGLTRAEHEIDDDDVSKLVSGNVLPMMTKKGRVGSVPVVFKVSIRRAASAVGGVEDFSLARSFFFTSAINVHTYMEIMLLYFLWLYIYTHYFFLSLSLAPL
jgi:hypothetical protein